MATSEVQICNSALIKVGAELIVNLVDNNKRAKLCRELYPLKRDELLRSHPWNFAITRKELGQTANTPVYGFDNEFELPSDCLRVIETNIEHIDEDFQIETNSVTGGRVLITNSTEVKIKYLKRITDVALFDKNFQEALAWTLASELAYPLTQSVNLSNLITAKANNVLATTRSYDAQEGGQVRQVEADEWYDARF